MKYICNPVIGTYKYQYIHNTYENKFSLNRESADPSIICFQGRYYLFASMTLSVWVSDDLATWQEHHLPAGLPAYAYAPDVCVRGDLVHFCACSAQHNVAVYTTKNILEGPYHKTDLPFPADDPKLFCDDDGRLYFFWGLSDVTPIYGVELDADTLQPISERKELIFADAGQKGYERIGENHSISPKTETEVLDEMRRRKFNKEHLPPETYQMIYSMMRCAPYIEGAWINRHQNRYYLQYAFAGTQYNIYGDGVYVSESPLGPYRLADNNPFSYSPGGFFPGAGHGSTFTDLTGNIWHAATMRISKNHNFERRIGIWPAGFDQDGELFCNQRFADWPLSLDGERCDPWQPPEWMLLSVNKSVRASSSRLDHAPELAVDENVQTWWSADAEQEPWLEVDLGAVMHVHAVQVNFADDPEYLTTQHAPGELVNQRFIVDRAGRTRWLLEASEDGDIYESVMDKSNAESDYAHDLVILEEGRPFRFIRLRIAELPFGQPASVSGLRVFGCGDGPGPADARYSLTRTGDLNFEVSILPDQADGHLILWGHQPDKLYHSLLTYDLQADIGALVCGTRYFVRVDAFNANGITPGSVILPLPLMNGNSCGTETV